MSDQDTLLEVKDLKLHFPFRDGSFFNAQKGYIRAVDGVSFKVRKGETLGLVGESGCGKSTTVRAIAQLYKPTSGKVLFKGLDL
ncbi:MAG TPA: ATP-binding cassette domain-containing protein, partial [Treponemataceae bacterium]|nr:ATP-binding cassette domain-containing protein [Treponemataceae bacterium]